MVKAPPLPKSWLIHTIVYEWAAGKDDWNKPAFDPPVAIQHVRYDPQTVMSRDGTQTKIQADAVIFVDAVHSTPIPEWVEESRITLNGRQWTLKKVVPCYQPESDEIHHWELEVI